MEVTEIKRVIKVLWSMIGIAILIFVLVVALSKRDAVIWRTFSVVMPLIQICLLGAVILTVIDYMRSK